jgi:hypothetical protein
MHLSTFSTRETTIGWVIDATKRDGRIEQLIGIFDTEEFAANWIADHPALWWKSQNA